VRRFLESAEQHGVELDVVSPEEIDLVVTRDIRNQIILRGQNVDLPDFVLPRTGSGTTYYTLAVIRHLERLGVSSFNSSTSIETVKDKLYTQQILAQSNFPVPRTMLARSPVDLEVVEKQVGFPVVVKTLSGSQGQGVFLCEDRRSLHDLMELIGATKTSPNIIFQEFVAASHGQDLRVFILGGRAIGAVRRVSKDGSFKANISLGGTAEPYKLTPEAEWLAAEVARILDLEIAGIDLLFDGEHHFKICEANSSPGFKGIEKVYGIDVPGEVFRFIRIRLGLA
jgi:gamma-F420-2:alpha-L-glutamate ligase